MKALKKKKILTQHIERYTVDINYWRDISHIHKCLDIYLINCAHESPFSDYSGFSHAKD